VVRRLELWGIVILLLAGFAVRIADLAANPAGFSEEEITSIRITRAIAEDETIVVFFDTGPRGIESLYHLIQVIVTFFIGDGLLGYRMLSVWAAMLSLALLFRVAKQLFGQKVAYVALIAMIAGIWPVINARTATPVALMNAGVLLFMWALINAYYIKQDVIRPQRPTTLRYTLMAITIVVITYLHYSGLLAGIGFIAFILYLYYSRQSVSHHIWWNSSYALNLALILGIPYLVSVLRNPTAAGIYTFWAERPESVIDLLESIGRTLLAFFVRGDRNPTHNVPGIPILSSIEGGVLLAVGVVICALRWRKPNYAFVLLLFTLGLLPDLWLQGGPDYNALAFIGPIVYLLVGVGVVELFHILQNNTEPPERLAWLKKQTILGTWPQPIVRISAFLLMLIFARYTWMLYQQIFQDWPTRSDTQQAYQTSLGNVARYLDQQNSEVPILICANRIQRADISDFSQPLSDQQILSWMRHGEEINYRIADCNQDFILINAGATMQVVFVDMADIATMPPQLRTWLNQAVSLSVERLPDGSLYEIEVEQRLADKGGMLARESTLFYPQNGGNGDNSPEPIETFPIRFGGNMTLLGYDPLQIEEPLSAGNILAITTYWRIDGTLLENTGIFIRLHDTPQASPYSEVNRFAVDATLLQPRDIVVQVSYLPLPETLRPQEYQLTIGVFDTVPTNQLPVYEEQGETTIIRGNYLLLGSPFAITAPQG